MCSNSSSEILVSVASSKTSYSSSYYPMCSSCEFTMWVSSLVLSIGLMWSYGSENWTDFTLGLWRKRVALWGPELDVLTFLLKSLGLYQCLWLLWRSYYLAEFLLIKRVLWKGGRILNLTSWCINNYLTSLLLMAHAIKIYFRFGSDKFIDLWKDLDWYCWPVCLWKCWNWLGLLWWRKWWSQCVKHTIWVDWVWEIRCKGLGNTLVLNTLGSVAIKESK